MNYCTHDRVPKDGLVNHLAVVRCFDPQLATLYGTRIIVCDQRHHKSPVTLSGNCTLWLVWRISEASIRHLGLPVAPGLHDALLLLCPLLCALVDPIASPLPMLQLTAPVRADPAPLRAASSFQRPFCPRAHNRLIFGRGCVPYGPAYCFGPVRAQL